MFSTSQILFLAHNNTNHCFWIFPECQVKVFQSSLLHNPNCQETEAAVVKNALGARFSLLLFNVMYKLALTIFIQFFCFSNGQTLARTLINIVTAFFLIEALDQIEGTNIPTVLFFLFSLYACVEGYNYSFFGEPFNVLSINCFDLDIIAFHPSFFYEAIFIFFLLIIFIFYVPKFFEYCLQEKYVIYIQTNFDKLLKLISLNFIFFSLSAIIIDFQGEHNQVFFDSNNNDLFQILKRNLEIPPKILSFKNPIDSTNFDKFRIQSNLNQQQLKQKRKNLIVLQLESIENQMISPNSMKYLYNLSQKYQFFAPITSTPYSTWSSTSSILIQCGLPQIPQGLDLILKQFDGIGYLAKMPCVPDYLKSIGYELNLIMAGPPSRQGLYVWQRTKEYKLNHLSDTDPYLFGYVNHNFFLRVKDIGRNQSDNRRFVGWILNHDSFKPYKPQKYCTPRNPKEPQWRQSADCIDQMIETFVEKFFEYNMQETTQLVILSDHITFGSALPKPHELFLLLPGIPKSSFKHRLPLTYYDISHTLLDLIGIDKYEPGFVFGNSMFSNYPGDHPMPENNDYNTLYHFYRNQLQAQSNLKGVHCFNGKKYEYSDQPCNHTFAEPNARYQ